MNVKNCPRCNRIFVPQGRRICPVCIREDEEKYERVRAFLRDHPGSTLLEVVTATEVDEDTVLQFIKEGRIESSDLRGPSLRCERCDAPIDSGKLCSSCQGALTKELQKAAGSLKPSSAIMDRDKKSRPKDKMFTADMKDKL
ncbi:flagellar protein [Heliobacterium undosum]|uniref:Flagellar protein n=1 Tax=Heliomicrobium undosum TaxID=121734 RepID=A0A845L980_9FIRM|nr:TIGR03826 family flagellar region protein [Heliomicrobium undosum]MZP29481.1 flagellar protein [Heliomicrobium undosum]